MTLIKAIKNSVGSFYFYYEVSQGRWEEKRNLDFPDKAYQAKWGMKVEQNGEFFGRNFHVSTT